MDWEFTLECLVHTKQKLLLRLCLHGQKMFLIYRNIAYDMILMPDGCSICSWCLMNNPIEDNHTNQIMIMMLSQTSRGGGGRRCMPKPTAEHVAAMAQWVTISEFSRQIFIRMWEMNDEVSARVVACSVPCVSQCKPVSAVAEFGIVCQSQWERVCFGAIIVVDV